MKYLSDSRGRRLDRLQKQVAASLGVRLLDLYDASYAEDRSTLPGDGRHYNETFNAALWSQFFAPSRRPTSPSRAAIAASTVAAARRRPASSAATARGGVTQTAQWRMESRAASSAASSRSGREGGRRSGLGLQYTPSSSMVTNASVRQARLARFNERLRRTDRAADAATDQAALFGAVAFLQPLMLVAVLTSSAACFGSARFRRALVLSACVCSAPAGRAETAAIPRRRVSACVYAVAATALVTMVVRYGRARANEALHGSAVATAGTAVRTATPVASTVMPVARVALAAAGRAAVRQRGSEAAIHGAEAAPDRGRPECLNVDVVYINLKRRPQRDAHMQQQLSTLRQSECGQDVRTRRFEAVAPACTQHNKSEASCELGDDAAAFAGVSTATLDALLVDARLPRTVGRRAGVLGCWPVQVRAEH